MKKIKLTMIFMLASPNVWALSDQLGLATGYHTEATIVSNVLESIEDSTNSLVKEFNTIIVNKQESRNEDIIVDKRENINDYTVYLELTSDIHPDNKKPNKNIKELQKQWGLPETGIYNQKMVKKVKEIQQNNNFAPTGIIDKNTWFTLYKQPKEWKVKVVSQAIENWNTIIEKHKIHKSDQMVVINIPSMKLYLYRRVNDKYKLLMESRVVIGRIKTQTPLIDFELISLKYNPSWTPTKNILKRNLYKNGELNIKWLEVHGLMLFDENGQTRPYEEIDLVKNPRFVQPSGDGNALGNLKFETSSKEDIYLHDTSDKHLFNYNTRLYSAGCVRVQDYIRLASFVSDKNEKKIQDNINKGNMFYERLPQRVPVYFDYSQVHFSKEGGAKFFADVYFKNKEK